MRSLKSLIRLHRETPLFRHSLYMHGADTMLDGWRNIEWLHPTGRRMESPDWDEVQAFAMALIDRHHAVSLLFNAADEPVEFRLPESMFPGGWSVEFSSNPTDVVAAPAEGYWLAERSIACLASRYSVSPARSH